MRKEGIAWGGKEEREPVGKVPKAEKGRKKGGGKEKRPLPNCQRLQKRENI